MSTESWELQINIVHRGKHGSAISHPEYHESHYIMEGCGTLVTGGSLVQRGRMTVIEGGQARVVRKGDAVVIPKNTPHWYSQIDGTLVYLENRFKAPTP